MNWESRMTNVGGSEEYFEKLEGFKKIIFNDGYRGDNFTHMINLFKSADGGGLIEKVFTITDKSVLKNVKSSVENILGKTSVLAETFNKMYEDSSFRKSCVSEYTMFLTLLNDTL